MAQSLSLLTRLPDAVRAEIAAIDAAAPLPGRAPTFALYTLGCKVNQYDSHQISRLLQRRGFRRIEFREAADLYVIDTCTVTAEADRKSRKAAARARRNNSEAVVAITGCAATYSAEQFRRVVPDALVLDHFHKMDLPERALELLRRRDEWARNYDALRSATGVEPQPIATRERAVLKVQDGCNHRCSFCIIPMVRGASVLKPRGAIVAEARMLVLEGARELVVTGVSMGDWGREQSVPGRRNSELCALLRALTTIEGLERVRVSSLDPADVDREFLETVAGTPGICPHIHLALQSGSASTLRRMRRRYTPELFARWAQTWREICPDGGLTTDVIVGFPGETSAEFEATLEMVRRLKFSAVHVFPYSPRAGTAAAELEEPVTADEQAQRVDALLQTAAQMSAEFASRFFGRLLPVLLEQPDGAPAVAQGRTPQYIKADIKDVPPEFMVGDVVWMRPEGWRNGALVGSWVAGAAESYLV